MPSTRGAIREQYAFSILQDRELNHLHPYNVYFYSSLQRRKWQTIPVTYNDYGIARKPILDFSWIGVNIDQYFTTVQAGLDYPVETLTKI